MKKYIATICFLAALPVMAQETYENANIATGDLNGTARYVGMGGAMEALGADISTMTTNPAGVGLLRHSLVSGSLGVVSQQDAENFDFGKKTNLSFDQIGFVYTIESGRNSYINVGFNYHKDRNFNYILRAAANTKGASQNTISYDKGADGYFYPDFSNDGDVIGYESETGDDASLAFSPLDYLYYNALLLDKDDKFYCNEASRFDMRRANKGYTGAYDFNISGNVKDRFFYGVTVGFKDVNYKNYSEYTEELTGFGPITIGDDRRIDGSGFDIKAGIIFRPVEQSPFRIGVYVHTPTWYELTTENYTTLTNNSSAGLYDTGKSQESYDFKMYTPWKFGISLGHTIGSMLALGATYEYADYSNVDSRIITGSSYDWFYDSYTEDSESDVVMNDHTKRTLKGVNTIKVGAELHPADNLYMRLGYNYVSAMYNEDGFKNSALMSPGSYYASASDFTNWKATNRITCGLGYNIGKMSLDLAYQYSMQKGDFSPFMSYYASAGSDMTDNIAPFVEVDNKRHQVLFTLGYHF